MQQLTDLSTPLKKLTALWGRRRSLRSAAFENPLHVSRPGTGDLRSRLNRSKMRGLVALLAPLTRKQAELMGEWTLQRVHPVLALHSYVQQFGIRIDSPKLDSLQTILAIVRGGCRVDDEQLGQLERAAARLERAEILALFPEDAWIQNFLLSVWEYATGVSELASYPWNVSLPVADVCNARCVFCTSWIEGKEILKLEQVDALADVIRRAVYLGLVGHGEPMSHPRFPELCEKLAELLDPRASCYTITNGFFLDKWRPYLRRIPLHSYSISLNAATPATHDEVMGLGPDAFDRIIDSIRYLMSLREQAIPDLNIHITLVVVRQNLSEVPRFIELGNELGVSGIWLRSLLTQPDLVPGLNYHLLPPATHPDFWRLRDAATAAIRASRVPVKAEPGSWDQEIFNPAVRERIEKSPPLLVPRERALRDRDLRRRTESLYERTSRPWKGRTTDPRSFSVVEWREGTLYVKTPAAQWAFAASVPIRAPADTRLGGRVEVDVEETQGNVGIGLLEPSANTWIHRRFVEDPGRQTVSLSVRAGVRDFRLVFENALAGGTPSSVVVHAARLLLDTGGGVQPVDDGVSWTGLTVENSVDPFDDGLNPMRREPRFACKAVYYCLYINEMYYRVNPCCYMQAVPGFEEVRFDGSYSFMEAWNSPAMVTLRTRLRDGPLFGACKKCPENW